MADSSQAVSEPEELDHEVEAADDDELSPDERRRRADALEQIVTFGDPILLSRASDVTNFGPALAAEAERMVELMHDAGGVGLAANQVGSLQRLLVFQAAPDAPASTVVNPEVEWRSDELEKMGEGCLSLPGILVDVERPLHIRISGQDTKGEPLLLEASGLEARVLQHEIDHLDGVLTVDRTSRDQRRGAMKALREGGSYNPHGNDAGEDNAGDV